MEPNSAPVTAHDGQQVRPKTSPWPRYDEAVLGFRNYWYPAMLSGKLRRRPVALQILGEKLVFFRQQGKCYALEDRCAHRGVPLSKGRCEFSGTATISCPYHGWTYDITSGICVGAITDGPDSPLKGKVRVAAYPVAERKGLIWVYIGDGPAPSLEEDAPEEMLRQDAVIGARVTLRPGNWRLAAENGMDPAHATYLHRDAWLAYFRRFPACKTNIVPEIAANWVGYTQGPPLLQCDYPGLGSYPGNMKRQWWRRPRGRAATKTQLRLPGFLRVNPFPAPEIVHFEWYVPVDERQHRYFQFSVKWTSGFKAWRFRLAYWFWWRWLAHVNFNGQDAEMVRLMDPFYGEEDGWHRERLFRPDVGLTAWRRYCHDNARAVQRLAYRQASFNGSDAGEESGRADAVKPTLREDG
jgi:phenylpropionate dioxygenase-like ring-hydroxylating dioxygenase large terminal subunit